MDAFAVIRASRAGYDIFWKDEQAFYKKEGKIAGPFPTLDEAAYAAIIEDEYKYAYDSNEEEDDGE